MTSLLIERRRNERSKVMLSINIEGMSRAAEGARKRFPDGACIVGMSLNEGSPVLIQRNGRDLSGRVTSASGNQRRISFAEPLNLESMLRPIAVPRVKVSYASAKARIEVPTAQQGGHRHPRAIGHRRCGPDPIAGGSATAAALLLEMRLPVGSA